MDPDQAAEFELFTQREAKLCSAYQREGYTREEAEGIAFHVAQGTRDVPTLLGMLDNFDAHSADEITDAVMMVLVNWKNLTTAYSLLLGDAADFSDPVM